MIRMIMLVALGSAFFVPAYAGAATMAGNQFTGEPGEANALTISYDPATATFTYTDSAAVIQDTALFDYCSASGHVATCDASKSSGFIARLGDRDDTLALGSPLPARLGGVVFGDAGNDVLDAGPGAIELGSVALMGGSGNDLLIGSPHRDGLNGDDGDDTILGNGGNDYIDGTPAPNRVFNASAGQDRIDGGPGSDLINGVEPGDVPPAADRIACGEGDEGLIFQNVPVKENHRGDEARIGERDLVGVDCEFLGQAMSCPEENPSDLCEINGDRVITSGPWIPSAAQGRGAPPLVFRARQTKAGESEIARAKLTKRLVKRQLRGRRTAKVHSVIRTRSSGEAVQLAGLRFRLKRR